MKYIGKKTKRLDGVSLVKGKPVFADDVILPEMLYLKILHSPHAHAIIKRIDTSKAERMQGVAVVLTHKDFKAHYYSTAGQGYPEPSPRDTTIFCSRARYVGDRIAAVAAEALETAEEALREIEVEYEILPAILNPQESIDNPIVIHPEEGISGVHDAMRNIAAAIDVEVGDVELALKQSKFTFEGEYSTPYVQRWKWQSI